MGQGHHGEESRTEWRVVRKHSGDIVPKNVRAIGPPRFWDNALESAGVERDSRGGCFGNDRGLRHGTERRYARSEFGER